MAAPARAPERPPSFALAPYAYAEARALADELGLAEPVAVTLVRRGYRTVDQARAFLEASERHDPFEFAGMAEVVDRLRAAIGAGRRITVHGDYDADGVCSTAILIRVLRELGARCDWHIPGRLEDGYGLTTATVRRLADRGTELLLTTDCGITACAEVEAAREVGIEAIVTDHHQPGDELPDCAVLHPTLSEYPCAELCATGVAYKLAAALAGEESANRDLDLVALATVADLVPLRGENRTLVRLGLAEARRARRPGLRALIAAASIEPERLDEGDLAFRLAPRINAAGRLYRADGGVELMLTTDDARAAAIAAELDRANRERRETEREVLAAAEQALAALPDELAEAPGLVVAGEGWHPGVVGIVASRLVERHLRPVVLLALDGEGRARGSGRSIPGFDLLAALSACEAHLVRYGGHRAAAGVELEAAGVDAFREAFAAHARATLAVGDLAPVEAVDAVVGGELLGIDVAEQFARLGPFGKGNPEIRLLVPGARLRDVRAMGEGERHARFTLESGGWRAPGVAFGVNGALAEAAERGGMDVSLQLEVNHWNGAVEPRVVLGEVYAHAPAPDATGQAGAGEGDAVPGEPEWLERLDAELGAPLRPRPDDELLAGVRGGRRRLVVDRRRASGIAAVAALASSGEPVLVVCADAGRRRALVERAAQPARFGGGAVALAAGRLADETATEALEAVRARGGVALADWERLERAPTLAAGFEHAIVVDPPPRGVLEDLIDRTPPSAESRGFLHLAWGDAEVDFALRVCTASWPDRWSLGGLYRELRAEAAHGGLEPAPLREAIERGRRHPPSAEVAARSLRVLRELDLIAWEGNGAARALRVVSSRETRLERSSAFVAYRRRCEEARRFLTARRQPT